MIIQLHLLNTSFEKIIITTEIRQVEESMKDILDESIRKVVETYSLKGM